MKIQCRKESGITIISLIVTIIVAIILAGVGVGAAFNKNNTGVIEKTQESTQIYSNLTTNVRNNMSEYVNMLSTEED